MITVFTHPECEYSKMLINELDDIGEKFQNINLETYQKLGNYICVNFPNLKYQSKLAELVFQIIKNYKRVKDLFNKPEIKINRNGAKVISKILLKKYDKKN